jgi:truncated hemoglobin YjbI/quinol monooxygenase YgiN
MQIRFRAPASRDAKELVHDATLRSLCSSTRCKHWELMERAGEPGRLVLHVHWEGDGEHENFRGSPECADFFRSLKTRVRGLEEAEYRADSTFLLASLGGEQGMLQLVSDILHEVSCDRLLAPRFGTASGERAARLGLWLIEVLGGPRLYSAATPAYELRVGPLPGEPLDVEERAQFLDLARHALHIVGGRGSPALGALEANLPLHPALPSHLPYLGSGESTPYAPPVR